MRLNPKITFHDLREDYDNKCLAEQVMQYLEEKLVVVGGGKNYGQVVFLAGGAGSGKGFAIKNYLEGNKFKVFDPDAFKDAFIRMRDALKNPQIKSYYQLKYGTELKRRNQGHTEGHWWTGSAQPKGRCHNAPVSQGHKP